MRWICLSWKASVYENYGSSKKAPSPWRLIEKRNIHLEQQYCNQPKPTLPTQCTKRTISTFEYVNETSLFLSKLLNERNAWMCGWSMFNTCRWILSLFSTPLKVLFSIYDGSRLPEKAVMSISCRVKKKLPEVLQRSAGVVSNTMSAKRKGIDTQCPCVTYSTGAYAFDDVIPTHNISIEKNKQRGSIPNIFQSTTSRNPTRT